MKKAKTEFRSSEDDSLQPSLKRARTDSTDILDENDDENSLDPVSLLFGQSSNFFQTPKYDCSSNEKVQELNPFDSDLFSEHDTFVTDFLADIDLTLEHSDQKQDSSNDTMVQQSNLLDPDLFSEFDPFETDFSADIDFTLRYSDQTPSVNPTTQNLEFNWDEISEALGLEFDSPLFESDETIFKR